MSDGAKRGSSSSVFHLLAGTTSGFTSSILLQPFDLLKTRVQQQSSRNASVGQSNPLQGRIAPRATPVFQALRKIWNEPQPLKQLWRGTVPSVIRTSFGSGLYFASLDRLRRIAAQAEASKTLTISNRDGDSIQQSQTTSTLPKLSVTANLATGALARASAGFIMMPLTVLKVRFESNMYTSSANASPLRLLDVQGSSAKNPYAGLFTATKEIARTEGLRGFFKGAGTTVIRDAPYAGIYLGFYEGSKTMLSSATAPVGAEQNVSGGASALVNFCSGALAATLATTMTNPPDVVKTRLQLEPEKYKNAVQAVRLLLKEEGLASLWGGLGLRVSRKALSSALAWTVYEEAVRRAATLWSV